MYTFIIIALIIHLLCCMEIVGSWILTKKYQDLRWNAEFTLLPCLFPPLSPIVAFDILTDAWPLYRYCKKNNACRYQESLFLFLTHGCRSIEQWYQYNRSLRQLKKCSFSSNELQTLSQ